MSEMVTRDEGIMVKLTEITIAQAQFKGALKLTLFVFSFLSVLVGVAALWVALY